MNTQKQDILLKNAAFLSIRGKVGDTVYVLRHGTNFARKWVIPNDPKTFKQRKQRKYFSTLVRSWQRLTPAEKRSWKEYAAKNSLEMSGYNHFISVNMSRIMAGKLILKYKCTGEIPLILDHFTRKELFPGTRIILPLTAGSRSGAKIFSNKTHNLVLTSDLLYTNLVPGRDPPSITGGSSVYIHTGKAA